MPSGFWFACDAHGLVHHVMTVTFPIHLQDNNVDYEDSEATFCNQPVPDTWVEAPADAVTTCVQCLGAWHQLESTASEYLLSRMKSGRLEIG